MSDYMEQDAERLIQTLESCAVDPMSNGYAEVSKRLLVAASCSLRILLAHIQRGAVPDGWQVVPKEPTPEMIKAAASFGGRGGYNAQRGEECASGYRDMLAAADAPDHFRDAAGVVIRTCSDERPCIPCYTDSGACLGPAPARTKAGRDAERRGRFLVECDDVALRVGPEHLGLCDAIDNDGQPYQSQALADEIAALRGEVKP